MKSFITFFIRSLTLVSLLCPLTLTIFTIEKANAEDIEIYSGQSLGIRPNALFILDTSGSMGAYEDEVSNYDPNIDYPDSFGFDRDRYYYSNKSIRVIRKLSSTDTDLRNIQSQTLLPAALVCETAIMNLPLYGFSAGKFKRWNSRSNAWIPRRRNDNIPSVSHDPNDIFECISDGGSHGITSGDFYMNLTSSPKTQYVTNKNIPTTYQSNTGGIKYLYTGNYLNYKFDLERNSAPTAPKSRMSIATESIVSAINNTEDIRLGLMRFDSSNSGGFVDVAIDDIENVRSTIESKINNYIANGQTPLSEAYYEAALYYRGDSVKFGKSSHSSTVRPGRTIRYKSNGVITIGSRNNDVNETPTPSAISSRLGWNYSTPITSACQAKNSILLFTDGEPSLDSEANDLIQQMIANVDFPMDPEYALAYGTQYSKQCADNAERGGCANELAYYLSHYDQNPNLPGVQTITTSVIGGFFDENSANDISSIEYMQSIAAAGKGDFILAGDRESISVAITEQLAIVSDLPSTFVAPAVAANSFNSLEHLDQLYYAMFEPQAGDNWKGNLKSYRLSYSGEVLDAKADNAIIDGVFTTESRSYWSDPQFNDGESVTKGGAASRISSSNSSDPAKILTYLGNTKPSSPVTLTQGLDINNITKGLLGIDASTTPATHQAIIDWANRIDSSSATGVRQQMEDPLHSRPIVVTYNRPPATSGGKPIQEGVVFVGTNSGYLHAFKADKKSFKEYFAFIPKELLKNIPSYINGENIDTKTYGIDGPINYWHSDFNKNGLLDIADNEKMYVFFGLRRGGNHYYALDITDPERPKFAWQIDGGSPGFELLGQTWSNMSLTKVPWDGGEKVVLLFGGGYDESEDNQANRSTNSLGRAVYMVDAQSGDLLWHASNTSSNLRLAEMKNSIPADITPVDFDSDSIADYFFAADVGGRVWRFDINKNNSGANNFATGGTIFDANKNSMGSYQRFYYAPSISYFAEKGQSPYLTISIGSGFRAHPLLTSSYDSFYTLKDYSITEPPSPYLERTPADLIDLKGSNKDLATNIGWKFNLAQGEKVLAKSLTANSNAYFTTFLPTTGTANIGSCTAEVGNSNSYSIYLGSDPDPLNPTGPSVTKEPLSSIGIPGEVIEIRTTDTGDKEFCKVNPGHPSCHCIENPDSCPDKCESSGSVIISGTEALGGGAVRCDLVKKDYWLIK